MADLKLQAVSDYFKKLSVPKTLNEVASDLSSTVTLTELEDLIERLEKSGTLEVKVLSRTCRILSKARHTKQASHFTTPVAAIRQSSGRCRRDFKSPALVKTPKDKPFSSRKPSPTTLHSEDTASKRVRLSKEVQRLDQELDSIRSDGYSEDELQVHIDKLHEYNEVKDIGQLLLGKLAEVEGTTTSTLYEKFGLCLDD